MFCTNEFIPKTMHFQKAYARIVKYAFRLLLPVSTEGRRKVRHQGRAAAEGNGLLFLTAIIETTAAPHTVCCTQQAS